VIDIILQHKALMQRPVVVKGGKAIVGRPKSRIAELIGQ
jgi:arsenate reductase